MARGNGGMEPAHKGPISVRRRAIKWLMGAASSMELSIWGSCAVELSRGSSWRRLMKLISSTTT